jgi:uncharacterized RDD family membrane protein YckC
MYTHTPAAGYAGAGYATAVPMGAGEAFGRRFAGALIDGILLSVVAVPLGFIIGLVFGIGGAAAGGEGGAQIAGYMAQIVSWVIGLVLAGGYYGWMYSTRGQSLGKMALGIRVIGPDGGNPSWGRAILREVVGEQILGTILFMLCLLPGLLAYLWMLWDPEQQTWFDKLAQTHVVRA